MTIVTSIGERARDAGFPLAPDLMPRLRRIVLLGEPVTGAATTDTASIRRARRERRYSSLVAAADATVAVGVVATATFIAAVLGEITPFGVGLAIGTACVWIALLVLVARPDTRDGDRLRQYRQVAKATLLAFGFAALAAAFVVADVRLFLVIAMPLGLAGVLASRALWSAHLKSQRASGEAAARVLVVGRPAAVERVLRGFNEDPERRFHAVAVVGGRVRSRDDVAEIARTAADEGADTVLLTEVPKGDSELLRALAWELEGSSTELIITTSFTEVSPGRTRCDNVAGESVVRVSLPGHDGPDRLKRSFDVIVSGILIVLAAPILLGVAIAVKVSGPGPVLYRQERIGLRGEPFQMMKFRSMRPGADGELSALLEAQGTAATPLFKVKDDPRITPVGRFIRKYSLDELPQLFNVFTGTMSLVGPRPQIADEVALYTPAASRRLLAQPGITGLWQVSGRSALSWDEAIRLDLRYVENRSLGADVGILARTVRAVLDPGETAH